MSKKTTNYLEKINSMSDTFSIKKSKISQAIFVIVTTLISIFAAIWIFSSEVSAIKNDIFNLQETRKKIPSIQLHMADDRVMFTKIQTTLEHIRQDVSDIKKRVYKK